MANGNKVVVFDRSKIMKLQCDQRLRSTRGGNELDPDCIGAIDLDDGTEITAPQSVGGQVMSQHDDV